MSAGTRIGAAGCDRLGPDICNPAGVSQASRRWTKATECDDDRFLAGDLDQKRKTTKLNALKMATVIGLSFLKVCVGGSPAFADTPSLPQQVAAIVQPQLNGVVQIRVTPKTRNPFTIRALLVSGVTWKWRFLNHANGQGRLACSALLADERH